MLVLAGCSSEDFANGYLPVSSKGVTNHTGPITEFWNVSWIVLFIVGFISWGLMAWALIVYRRRKGDNTVPPQLRYNNPIETLFTVVPLILVIGFFALTAKTMTEIEKPIALTLTSRSRSSASSGLGTSTTSKREFGSLAFRFSRRT